MFPLITFCWIVLAPKLEDAAAGVAADPVVDDHVRAAGDPGAGVAGDHVVLDLAVLRVHAGAGVADDRVHHDQAVEGSRHPGAVTGELRLDHLRVGSGDDPRDSESLHDAAAHDEAGEARAVDTGRGGTGGLVIVNPFRLISMLSAPATSAPTPGGGARSLVST